jgi:hypothetical protein
MFWQTINFEERTFCTILLKRSRSHLSSVHYDVYKQYVYKINALRPKMYFRMKNINGYLDLRNVTRHMST